MAVFEDVEIKWLGHASFKIVYHDKVIFIDPYNVPASEEEFADYILITHEHYDHFSPKDIKKLQADKTEVIATPGCISKMEGELVILPTNEKRTFPDFTLYSVPAYNIGKAFHPKDFGNGYVIQIGTQTIYHAGDTDFIPEMEKLREFEIDIALLPVGGTFTMDVREAVKAIKAIQPKKVWPMHYGTLPQTTADIDQLKQLIKNYELNVEVITE